MIFLNIQHIVNKMELHYQDFNFKQYDYSDIDELFAFVCSDGYLDVAKYLYQKTKINFNSKTLLMTCRNNYFEISEWLMSLIDKKNAKSFDFEKILNISCEKGNLNITKRILENYPGNYIYNDNFYCLRIACINGHIDIVKFFLEFIKSLNVHTQDELIFRLACENGQIHLAKYLLKTYPDICISKLDNYAFKHACLNCHTETAKWLLEMNPVIINEKVSKERFTKLIKNNNIELITLFLQSYFDLQNDYEEIFNFFCEKGPTEIVDFLIKIKPENSDNSTEFIPVKNDLKKAFTKALTNNNLKVVKLLFQKNPEVLKTIDTTHIFTTCFAKKYFEITSWIIENSPNKDIQDFHYLFSKKKNEIIAQKIIVSQLSQHKLSLKQKEMLFREAFQEQLKDILDWIYNKVRKDNESKQFQNILIEAFDYFYNYGNDNMARFILNLNLNLGYELFYIESQKLSGSINKLEWIIKNASFIDISIDKEKMFLSACDNDNLEMAQFIAAQKPETDIRIFDNLFFRKACERYNISIVKWIYKNYPDTNLSMIDEYPFRTACKKNNLELAKWLLETKPDINISIMDEYAFRNACTNYSSFKLLKWLLEIKPDINIRACDDKGYKSVCKRKNEESILLLQSYFPKIYNFKKIDRYNYVCIINK